MVRVKPPLVFCSSRTSPTTGLPQLLESCAALGGTYHAQWNDDCTHLVVPSGVLSLTHKVLCALLTGAAVVSPVSDDDVCIHANFFRDKQQQPVGQCLSASPPPRSSGDTILMFSPNTDDTSLVMS